MKKFNKPFCFFLLFTLSILQACNDNEVPVPTGKYESGVFISNEGNFGRSNASVTFYNKQTQEVEHGIFEAVNKRPLGDVLQNMYFHQGRGYLVLNGSNKLEVVHETSFQSVGVIEDELANPRYFTASGNKGYLSNWGNFDESFQLDQSFVAVINLDNLAVIKKINTNEGTNHVALIGNKVFASNNFTNTLSIISTTTDEIEVTLELAPGPGNIVEDVNGDAWVICQGDFEGNNGKLFIIDPSTNSIVKEIGLGLNPSTHLVANKVGNKMYYASGKSIYELSIDATAAPSAALISNDNLVGNFYGLGIDPQTNILFTTDAVGFQGSGRVYRYELDGTQLDDFSAGIGPNGFVFQP